YAYDHRTEYDAVFWVTADPPSKLVTDYAHLAQEAKLPAATMTADVNDQIRAVRRWLESPGSGRWLLVFDNADEPDVLRGYLPTPGSGHVVITPRRSRWDRNPRSIEVRELERPASIKLLLAGSGQSDEAAADRLAAALGDLPLALAQAAGYLADSGLPLGEYL